jgi:hypothetical protein
MQGRLIALVTVALVAVPASADAAPVSGAHATVDYTLTTTEAGAPTGWSFTGSYFASNGSGDPPYMRSMTFANPSGFRFDTSVPDRCTAGDAQLALFGASACPLASRVGGGTATGKFMGRTTTLQVTDFNNADEQIMLVQSPLVATVARGRIASDGSITFASPTCYPAAPGVTCPVDDVLQMGSSVGGRAYTRTADGVVRSYLTTPASCPATGYWQTPIEFNWADGSQETDVVQEPC